MNRQNHHIMSQPLSQRNLTGSLFEKDGDSLEVHYRHVLPPPNTIAKEIAANLESAFEQFSINEELDNW